MIFQTIKCGYNLTAGGETNPMDNPDTRKKVSESKMGEKNPSFGNPGTWLGRKHKPESIEKMRAIVPWNKGQTKDTDSRIHGLSGKNHPMFGKIRQDSANFLKKWNKEHAIRAMCIETGEIFNSLTECAKNFNGNVSVLSRYLKGKRGYNSFKKLHFKII